MGGRIVAFCLSPGSLLALSEESYSAEGVVNLPITALPVDVSIGEGAINIIGLDEAIILIASLD